MIVNGILQGTGTASFGDLGSIFVDVFMDNTAVSPSLIIDQEMSRFMVR